jgi:hypothetical protein
MFDFKWTLSHRNIRSEYVSNEFIIPYVLAKICSVMSDLNDEYDKLFILIIIMLRVHLEEKVFTNKIIVSI